MKGTFLNNVKRPIPAILLGISLLLSAIEWRNQFTSTPMGENKLAINELFDPSFKRLTSLSACIQYCDSNFKYLLVSQKDTFSYVNFVAEFIKKRFYHGYSYFRPGYNTIGWMAAPILHKDLSATVIPDDILKFPHGACSQQSIIFFELLQKKGLPTRKVGFFDSTTQGGHFASEVYWGGKWHYYDVNKEPDVTILERMGRPSFDEVYMTPGLVDSVYRNADVSAGLFKNHFYGKPNEPLAPNATIYHRITKFISLTLPIWVLLTIWIWGLLSRRNMKSV